MPPVWEGYSGPYTEARSPLDFHSCYRTEQGELPPRKWKPKIYFEKTHFHRKSRQAVTKSPTTAMLFRYLRGRMNGAFLLGKQALCHQSPVSRLTRSIHRGPELPGSMQFSVTDTGVEVRFVRVLEILLPLN